ncbi:MAG: response regulator [Myxococcales bacterium]|nr:response regulator [Myxococcales bacterium]
MAGDAPTRAVQKVLLVDDDDDVRTLGLLSLRRIGGWEAVAVADGATALTLAASEAPDVILLDVQMPGLDGPATLEALRREAATAAIPVVFLTAQADEADLSRYRQLGAQGVIRKPFAPLELPDALRRALADDDGGCEPQIDERGA